MPPSEVTNVLLAFSILQDADARFDEVNGRLAQREQLPLGDVWRTEAAVAARSAWRRRSAQAPSMPSTYPTSLAFLQTVVWSRPDEVQVMVHGQHDTRWRTIDA